MTALAPRSWHPDDDRLVQSAATRIDVLTPREQADLVVELAEMNRRLHDRDCINLNPAANAMNPRAEMLLSSGLGSRPSLGHPGAKYEMGLEAIEQIEAVAAALAAQVFDARFAEVRIGSGALANLYVFMATCSPGDTIIAPPAEIGGHVTHHLAGAAGRYGLRCVAAPIDADGYTVDIDALASLAQREQPRLITIGGSLNLDHHPVGEIRSIADAVGATVMFDAAHLSGLIAGEAWPNPLHEGAHVMTMSTYKSLGGPPAGLLVTDDAAIAERIDAIAFPGLTANFDVANTAALAVTLTDWLAFGSDYARDMIDAAQRLADRLMEAGVPVHTTHSSGHTRSHAFALDAGAEGGHAAAQRLRRANVLTSAIGLPHDTGAGVRVGTNEIVRWGMHDSLDELADVVAAAWFADNPRALGPTVSAFRQRFESIGYCNR